MDPLDVFFNPKSIAIIGASESIKFGHSMTKYLLNSPFRTFPVNISKEEIFGHKAYSNINDIKETVELAIIIIRNDFVLDAIKNCVEKGVKGIIIESAGFSETGDENLIEIQQEIERIAQKNEVRIVGPNCVGITNFRNKFTSTEIDFDEAPEGGNISVVAQSGVLGNIIVDWGASQKIGFSKTITIGNKVDVDEIDMLEYLDKDPETSIIALYIEGVKRGPKFIMTLKNLSKPVLIMKNGRSQVGSIAIKSHTGSIAGNDKIYNAIFNQIPGVFRVDDFYEMFNIAHAFATQPLPRGKNIAITTSSGSLGALTCDLIEKNGLNLASLNESTIKYIESISPNWVSARNPVDLGPSSFSTFRPSLKALLDDPNVDALLNIFAVPKIPLKKYSLPITPQLRDMKSLSKKTGKPIITCVFGSRWVFDCFLKHSTKYNLSIMTQLNHAVKALKLMYAYYSFINK